MHKVGIFSYDGQMVCMECLTWSGEMTMVDMLDRYICVLLNAVKALQLIAYLATKLQRVARTSSEPIY